MPFTTTQLPTDPTSDELAERDKLCHSLKIAFPILGIITAVILGVGIYLAADPGKHN